MRLIQISSVAPVMSFPAKECNCHHHVSLVSFKLGRFLSLPLTLVTLMRHFGTLRRSHFLECITIWVRPMFTHNLIEVVHIRQECHQMITRYGGRVLLTMPSSAHGCDLSHDFDVRFDCFQEMHCYSFVINIISWGNTLRLHKYSVLYETFTNYFYIHCYPLAKLLLWWLPNGDLLIALFALHLLVDILVGRLLFSHLFISVQNRECILYSVGIIYY